METRGYQAAPFQITRWAAVIAVLAALAYLIYLMVDPFGNQLTRPERASMRLIDWILYGSPIVLLVVMTISAFASRVVILLHITAVAAACSIPVVLLNSRNQEFSFLVTPICIWVLMYFHAFALRRERHRLASNPDPENPSPHRVTEEIHCIFCDYNLNNQMTDGVCPECGLPVGPSLVRTRPALNQPHWFYIVRQGLRFFALGTLLQFAIDMLFQYTRAFIWHPEYANYGYFLAVTLQLLGVWMLTVKDRDRGDRRGRFTRIMIRILATLYTLLYWSFLLNEVLSQLAAARKINPGWVFDFPFYANQFEVMENAIYVFLLWHVVLYTYILATRLPSPRAGRAALIGGFMTLVSAGISVLFPVMRQCFLQFAPTSGDQIGDILQNILDQTPDVYLGLFAFIFSILFWQYYKRSSRPDPRAQ